MPDGREILLPCDLTETEEAPEVVAPPLRGPGRLALPLGGGIVHGGRHHWDRGQMVWG